MILKHQDLTVELNDEWLLEAEMINFAPLSEAYIVDHKFFSDHKVCLIPIKNIAPVRRSSGVPIFSNRDLDGISAKERVIRLLRGFVKQAEIPPIELKKTTGKYPYELADGCHRLYCSLAAGFTHIPAVPAFDLEAFDKRIRPEDLC